MPQCTSWLSLLNITPLLGLCPLTPLPLFGVLHSWLCCDAFAFSSDNSDSSGFSDAAAADDDLTMGVRVDDIVTPDDTRGTVKPPRTLKKTSTP